MRFSIGCVDGIYYQGDYTPDSEVEETIASGIMWIDAWTDNPPVEINTVKDFGDFMVNGAMGREIDGFEMKTFGLHINGVLRTFNPKHIVWVEVTYDDDAVAF